MPFLCQRQKLPWFVAAEDAASHSMEDILPSDSGSEATEPEGDYEVYECEGADQAPTSLGPQDYNLVNHNKGIFHVVVECEESHP